MRELQRQREAGVNLIKGRLTVQKYLDDWLEYTVKQSCETKTYASYEETCRNRINPYVGTIQLDKLQPEHVQKMVIALQSKGLAERTIQYAVNVLSRALNKAVKFGHIARNVAMLVIPRATKHNVEPLTPEQARALLKATQGHHLEVLYRVALNLGLRRGEILSLRWADVNLDKHLLTVQKSKTPAGARTLPIPPRLVEALRNHWIKLQEERRSLGTNWKEHGLIFPSEVGTPLNPNNLHRHFKATLKKAGLSENIRFHDLRHSCATFLISQGVNLHVVKEILGQSRISVTSDIYGHLLPEVQQDVIENIDRMLG
jgi:integrase